MRRLRLRRRQQPASTRTRWLLALAAGAGTCLIIARPAGLGVGALAATGTWLLLGRQEPTAVRLEREQAVGELPWAADLVAAALRAGVPLDAAVLAVAAALPGPLATRLRRIGRSLRLGATPVEAWQHLSDLPMAARLTAAVERSSASGTALAGALHRCADDLRADAGFRRQATAQRNAVLVVLPLGLCFLPAFVLAGLVPVVLAVLGEVL
ncbi:type II secretion system F family protein [Catellatospora tritici]|uniref:type II secretion system F family protein n=1 Tax=Catellatospora tritici TaxID=2851566 RepID=UPI003557DB46